MSRARRQSNQTRRHVYLVGFSGSGKSTIGPILARKLRRPFVDSDSRIEALSGESITNTFRTRGERVFRQLEEKVIKSCAASRAPLVVALGGGALLRTASRRTVFKSGVVVYLSCSMATLYRRMKDTEDRPLLDTDKVPLRKRIQELMAARRPFYLNADITVTTTRRTPARCATLITELLRSHYGVH